jgi:hypothetical protein
MAELITNTTSKKSSQRQIFFHCGAGKTGSSALQAYFYANKEALKNAGISYQNTGEVTRPDQITSGNGTLLHGIAWRGTVSADELDAVIESYFCDTPQAICSSENLAWFSVNDWQKIQASCIRLTIEPKFVSFVRDIEPFYISAYHQMVKRAGEWRSFEEFFADAPTIYNHLQHVRDIADVFGQKNICVLHYETVKKYLDQAFFNAIGRTCELFDRTLLNQAINRSLVACELDLLKKINRATGRKFSTEISDLLIYARPNLTGVAEKYPDILPVMIQRHAQDIAWTNQTFFNGENTLKVASDNIKKNAVESVTRDELLNIQGDVFSWALQKIAALQSHNTARLTEDTAALVRAVFDQQEALLEENFDSDFYLKTYPDVADAKVDPLKHYQEFGMREGRLPRKNLAELLPTLLENRELKLRETLKNALEQSENRLAMLLAREADFTKQLIESEQHHQVQLAKHRAERVASEELRSLHLVNATKLSQQHSAQLSKQELAFTQELQKSHELYSSQLAEQSHEYAEQQKRLHHELESTRKAYAAQLSEMYLAHSTAINQYEAREKKLLEDSANTRSSYENQKLEQERQQNALKENLREAQRNLIVLQQKLADRDAKFSDELTQLHNENTDRTIVREIAHSEKLESLQALHTAQINAHLDAHATNQQAFLAQLAILRADALTLQEGNATQLQESNLKNLALSDELSQMRKTRIWRWTAPLRAISD